MKRIKNGLLLLIGVVLVLTGFFLSMAAIESHNGVRLVIGFIMLSVGVILGAGR